jgi:hypothetical protein
MRRWRWCALLTLGAGACDLGDLTREQLFGPVTPVADAGASRGSGDPAPGAPVFVSGAVYSACSGLPIDALVGIAGRHLCSFPGKGSFFFRIDDVPAGVTVTVTAAKKGYRPYSAPLTLDGLGVSLEIILSPQEGDCATNPQPSSEPCLCQMASCVSA